MRESSTPQDNYRVVELDTLLGNRGAKGARAVRFNDIPQLKDGGGLSLQYKSAVLAANANLFTAGAWVNGPSLQLSQGVWLITAMAMFQYSVLGNVSIRVFDGAGAQMANQTTHPAIANAFTTLNLSGIMVLSKPSTLTLQAASQFAQSSTFLIAQSGVASAHPATRLTAVQIGY